eukprot:3887877-Alexandrium_andersonii.AAC.1
MSASLVGSEMCIRDSKGSVDFNEDGNDLAERIIRVVPLRRGCPECINACLLYTSDAADDM